MTFSFLALPKLCPLMIPPFRAITNTRPQATMRGGGDLPRPIRNGLAGIPANQGGFQVGVRRHVRLLPTTRIPNRVCIHEPSPLPSYPVARVFMLDCTRPHWRPFFSVRCGGPSPRFREIPWHKRLRPPGPWVLPLFRALETVSLKKCLEAKNPRAYRKRRRRIAPDDARR